MDKPVSVLRLCFECREDAAECACVVSSMRREIENCLFWRVWSIVDVFCPSLLNQNDVIGMYFLLPWLGREVSAIVYERKEASYCLCLGSEV